MSSVSGATISREPSTSSRVTAWSRWAFGLSAPAARALTATRARPSTVTPRSRISRRPRLAYRSMNELRFSPAPGSTWCGRSTSIAPPRARNARCRSSGKNIFSAPTARAVSYCPPATALQARCRAFPLEAHAFSTLVTGTVPCPIAWITVCPRMHSWPVVSPASALPKKTA